MLRSPKEPKYKLGRSLCYFTYSRSFESEPGITGFVSENYEIMYVKCLSVK